MPRVSGGACILASIIIIGSRAWGVMPEKLKSGVKHDNREGAHNCKLWMHQLRWSVNHKLQESHLCMSHTRPGLSRQPWGWWKIKAMLMHHGCESSKTCKSNSNKWQSRIIDGVISIACMSASVIVISLGAWADRAVMPREAEIWG